MTVPSKLVEAANVVYKLGLPIVLVLWLVWFITAGVADTLKAQSEDHRAISKELSGMRTEQKNTTDYLRAICYKLPTQRGVTFDPCDQYDRRAVP